MPTVGKVLNSWFPLELFESAAYTTKLWPKEPSLVKIHNVPTFVDRAFVTFMAIIDIPPIYSAYYSGWWYTYPSEKYDFVSWDDCSQCMESHKSHVPVTTNITKQ